MQNLLRPNQVADSKLEEQMLVERLKQPDVDRGAVSGQLRRLRDQLETQTPQEVTGKAEDAMVKETDGLLEKILIGMPSQEEMRKSPPGAVDKHMKWERRNKENITRWKNNRLRLNAGSEETEIANLERFRPRASTLSMDNAQIPGQQYYFPPGEIPIQNLMSEKDKEALSATRVKLVAQAIKDNDAPLAKFLGIDLKELKKPPKAEPESIL